MYNYAKQFMQSQLKMAARWLPNIEEVFESLYPFIIGAQQHLNSTDRNDSDYWLRRVKNYESVVNLLLARTRASSYRVYKKVDNLETALNFTNPIIS